MLEFNLLPDVKIEFIKARNLRRLVVSTSFMVSAVFVGLFILLILYVYVVQRVHINNLDNTINNSISRINPNANFNKILTVQNQLKSLPIVQSETPDTTKLFNYLSELVPVSATVSTLNLNLPASTMSIQGGADSLNTVNQFIDTLKFTTYNNGSDKGISAFSSITLSSFGYSNQDNNGTPPASYTVDLSFSPGIFSSSSTVSDLNVPTKDTTRSVLGTPTVLFQSDSSGSGN